MKLMAVGGWASAVNSDNGGGDGRAMTARRRRYCRRRVKPGDNYVKTILQYLFATNIDADRQLDATLIIIMNTSKVNTCDTS